MRFRHALYIAAFAASFLWSAYGQTSSTHPTTRPDLDVFSQYQGSASNGWRPAVYAKPRGSEPQALRISNLLVHTFGDSDGIHVVGNAGGWRYTSILINDVEVTRGYVTEAGRKAKLHVDAMQIDNRGGRTLPLVLRSVSLTTKNPLLPAGATDIHDSLIVQGIFSTVTLDAVSADSAVKIGEVNGSSRIPLVVVQNSPGLRVYAMRGIDAVTLINSPGAVVKGIDGGSPLVTVEGDDWQARWSIEKRNADALRLKQAAIEKWIGEMPR